MRKRRAPKGGITKADVVQEALAMLEDEGLDALGLRGLASRLAVRAPALYWHLSGKGELLGLMAGEIYRQASDSVGTSGSWREWLLEFGRAFRRALLSH